MQELDYKASWALKNLMLLNCGAVEDSWESLNCKAIKPVNLKGRQSLTFTGRTDAEDEALIVATWCDEPSHWKRPRCWERLRAEEMVTEDEMVGWHHQLNGHEFEQTVGDTEGQGSLVCCSPWSHKELDRTWPLNNKTTILFDLPPTVI